MKKEEDDMKWIEGYPTLKQVNPVSPFAVPQNYFGEMEAHNYEQAKATFHQVIDVDYKNEDALYALGECYMQQDSLPLAYKYFSMAAKMDPKYAEAYYKMGRCQEEFKHYDEAKSLYQQCLNIKHDYKLALDGMKRLGGN